MNPADALMTLGALLGFWVLALCLADVIGTYLFSKALAETSDEEAE